MTEKNKKKIHVQFKKQYLFGISLIILLIFIAPIFFINLIDSKITSKEVNSQNNNILGVNITYSKPGENDKDLIDTKVTLNIPVINKKIDTDNITIKNIRNSLQENPQLIIFGGVLLSVFALILGVALLRNVLSTQKIEKKEKDIFRDSPI